LIPHYTKIHIKFRLNGMAYNREYLKEVAYSYVKEGEPYEQAIGNFLLDWIDEKDHILERTSGSTGTPKIIKLMKKAMVRSAIATGDYFNLKPGDSALHCISTNFVAGKMMLVRAIILGLRLDIVEPRSHPYIEINTKYNFCAMVPMQVKYSINELHQIRKLIIGGAPVSGNIRKLLQDIDTNAYATYGMTETLTHIAIKPLNHNPKDYFEAMPNVKLSEDDRGCLVVEAPDLFTGNVVTNDIVRFETDTSFEFLGRYDNIINSGGVKLNPEQIEAKLSNNIKNRFFIAAQDDETLGEKVILIIEGDDRELLESAFEDLDTYEKPRSIYSLKRFIETSSGKINRRETLKLLKNGVA